MTPALGFAQVVVDCQDAAKLAAFYAELLGRPIGKGTNEFFAVIPGSTEPPFPQLMFLQVPEPRTGKNRLHIDLVTDDKEAAIARAVELGATRLGDFDEYGAVWSTLSDPEGNVFDIGEHVSP
jgi:catechol 2,3-dioxygenase-like lactoylglutathione lyase family enzyme